MFIFMKIVQQRIQGELTKPGSLLLRDAKPARDAAGLVYLRFGFVTLGKEEHLFPSFLLDDWGSEVRGMKVYSWVREHGEAFPRAEIFGFDVQGNEIQFFVRELELYMKLVCYAFTAVDQPMNQGELIQKIMLPDAAVREPAQLKKPPLEQVKRPLRSCRVSWWAIPELA